MVKCCDRKSRAAWAQRFAPWHQATIELTRRDHSIIACCFWGADGLLILDRWACSSWEKCKRLLQPLLFRCSNRRGGSFWYSSKQVTCTWPLLRKCARSNAFTWCPCFWTKVAMRRGASEVLSDISEQLLGVGMTLSIGRRHAYEKDTLLQTMRLPLGESGVWGSRISPAVKARWQRVGTTRSCQSGRPPRRSDHQSNAWRWVLDWSPSRPHLAPHTHSPPARKQKPQVDSTSAAWAEEQTCPAYVQPYRLILHRSQIVHLCRLKATRTLQNSGTHWARLSWMLL